MGLAVGLFASALVSASAQAQVQGETAAARSERLEQNKNADAAFELRLGRYLAQVDSEFSNGKTPFKNAFGTDLRFQLGFEGDYQFLHIRHVGSLAIGGLASYTSASGTASASDPSVQENISEPIGFSLWTFAALATFRLDVLARETFVPIVPYAKIGPAVALWTSSNGRGTSVTPDPNPNNVATSLGRGKTGGIVYAIGAMFLLDAFDRQAAKNFALERGVLHSYAFAEYSVAQLNGLGQTNALHVGDRGFTFGLAFEL
jgi:hypothetical protein